jgi:hypothetical protein
MEEPNKQPEGASNQAVGALIGALIGLGIAARQIFSDYGEAAQIPWVQGIGITMAGGVVGLLLATLFASGNPEEKKPILPEIEDNAKARFDPPREGAPDDRIQPGHGINGVRLPDDHE